MKRSIYESKFTSTVAKMLKNHDIFLEASHGLIRPRSIQLSPTDRCNLSCSFCSVKDREMDELEIVEAVYALVEFHDLGARTVEITGGGDPTCYGEINQLLDQAFLLGYKVGLITNGILLHRILGDNLARLKWIRISMNSLDYVSSLPIDLVPHDVAMGFSYVWNEKSNVSILDKIEEYAGRYNARYVRIVPNCLSIDTINEHRKTVRELVKDRERFFFQEKDYHVPSRCRIGYLKPFVNSDGYVYHCSAIPLIHRKFDEHYRMCHISQIEKKWENVEPFDTSLCQEGKCFFGEQNDLLELSAMDIEHEEFL